MQERRKNADEGDRSDGRLVLLTSFILAVFGNLEGEGIRANVIVNMVGRQPLPFLLSFCPFARPAQPHSHPDK